MGHDYDQKALIMNERNSNVKYESYVDEPSSKSNNFEDY